MIFTLPANSVPLSLMQLLVMQLMVYFLSRHERTHAGIKYAVNVTRSAPNAFRLQLGERSVDIVARKLNDGGLLIQVWICGMCETNTFPCPDVATICCRGYIGQFVSYPFERICMTEGSGNALKESLKQVDGQSHVVHSEEEPMGTRLTIDSLTCLLANETDPSRLVAVSPGKLVRYLIPDGSHVHKDQPYVEIEVNSLWHGIMMSNFGSPAHSAGLV